MTQHRVISEDSMSAMDEISKVLGNDAVILSTKKNNGKIEIIGSNDIKDILKSKKSKSKNLKPNFHDLFSKEPLQSSTISINKNEIKNQDIPMNPNLNEINLYKTNLDSFKREIYNLLQEMIITDIDGISNSFDKTTLVQLIKKGFSKQVINSIFLKLENSQKEKNEINFYEQLSKDLVFSCKDKLYSSSLIFVCGLTGVGKTTLSAKIASYLLDSSTTINNSSGISLLNLSTKSTSRTSDLINYGRLLNINVHSFCSLKDFDIFWLANKNRKLIVDVSQDFLMNHDFNKYLSKKVLEERASLFLAMQTGTNKRSIKNQISLFTNLSPILALTKLDETFIGNEEISNFLECKCKIGLLSSSKNIVETLAFAKKEILAQYMNEI